MKFDISSTFIKVQEVTGDILSDPLRKHSSPSKDILRHRKAASAQTRPQTPSWNVHFRQY
ncbi:hypothetical protein PILCRDRAFT_809809 [Piloderma croceum F 1598]|uniref:Uncharacterized protein n=1 Tax=Piloderma croceum (strain F 1598) TaxID=765440 RepID=A0A0C3G6F2_PILCF|nr:hypothetical protein PILCRDRAFT_809809 [Piloderma croceum F 1598]